MKIGMILDKTFPPDPRVENEAVSLIENGHEVYLFCLKYKDEPTEETMNGIFVKRYESSNFIYKLSALAYTIPLYSFIMAKKIKQFLMQYKIEAIHIHDMQIAAAVFKANKKLNLKTILDLHENRPEIMKFYPHLQKFPGNLLISPKIWSKREATFINKAINVIVVTQEAKNEVVERVGVNKNKIVAVPNTVHKNYQKNAIINEEIIERYKDNFVVLYLGDTGLRRGLSTAIESVLSLKNSIQNIKLVIVGNNSTDEVLKRQTIDLGLEDYVDFEGWQSEKLFPSYIKASNVCISPLHRNKHHDTTYANKIFQYMSFAKPVLVSDAISQKKIVEKNKTGLVHKAEDVADFTLKLLQLHKDKKLSLQLGLNGKAFIEDEFCWELTSKNLITLYKNLKP